MDFDTFLGGFIALLIGLMFFVIFDISRAEKACASKGGVRLEGKCYQAESLRLLSVP